MALIKLFLEICLFRRAPQDVPYSGFLFGFVFLLYIVGAFGVTAMQAEAINIILQVAVQTASVFVFVWACLHLTNYRHRFLQTFTAFLGTDIVITVIALPFLFWIRMDPKNFEANIFLVVLILWQILVMGHILRYAIEKSFGYGFGLSLLFVFLSFEIMAAMLPAAA